MGEAGSLCRCSSILAFAKNTISGRWKYWQRPLKTLPTYGKNLTYSCSSSSFPITKIRKIEQTTKFWSSKFKKKFTFLLMRRDKIRYISNKLAFIFSFSMKNLVTRFKLPLLLIFVILNNLVSLISLYNLGNYDILVSPEYFPLLKTLFKGKTDIISITNQDCKYFFIIFLWFFTKFSSSSI